MDVINLTWEAVREPAGLGLAVLVIMLLLLKPALHLLFLWRWEEKHGDLPPPDPWPQRSLAVNITAFVLAQAFAAWRLAGAGPGPIFITGLVGFTMSVAAYEPLKNALKALGFDLDKLNWLTP